MEAINTPPQQVAELFIGVAPDLSFAALTVVTMDTKRHEFIFPANTIPSIHAQLTEMLRKYPGLSA